MRRLLLIVLPLMSALALTTATAQAVVVDTHAIGQPYVQTDLAGAPYVAFPTDQAHYVGVALVPGTRATLSTAGVPYVASTGPCTDPTLTSDLVLADWGLCYHGGPVVHRTETFAVTWDPQRGYWSGTRGYVEQFLRDVADGSGTLNSPFALTSQYTDSHGRALNQYKYGGGCIDYGNPNHTDNANTTCLFNSSVQTGPGTEYPASGCPLTGSGDTCLTDDQLRGEVSGIVDHEGILDHTQPGYTPMIVLLTPVQVEVCLDAAGKLCSANSTAPAQFCSYHSHLSVSTPTGNREVDYVVQPWTGPTACTEPDAPKITGNPDPATLSVDLGGQLVSPLSQALIPAVVDPQLTGWFSLNGSEMDDNGCGPEGNGLDTVPVGGRTYVIQREFNNGAALESDPFTYGGCAPNVILNPHFVVPSPIDQGEVVGFDGSVTASTLVVPNASYVWSFGDGSTGTGPSMVHSFAKSGYYKVSLTTTDRGGYVRRLSQIVEVLGPDGQPPSSGGGPGPGPGGGGGGGTTPLKVRLQLLPQSLRSVLSSGLAVEVSSNQPANGFATLSIFRSAAHRAHLSSAGSPNSLMVIGRGTVSGIKDGTVSLRVHISSATAGKLAHSGQLTLTLHLTLYAKNGRQTTATAVGRY